MLFSSRIRVILIRIRFSVMLVSGYAHVFALLSVVVVTLPFFYENIRREQRKQQQQSVAKCFAANRVLYNHQSVSAFAIHILLPLSRY